MKDINSMKKAELVEYIEKLHAEREQAAEQKEEAPPADIDVLSELERLRAQNQALAAALRAGRQEVQAARMGITGSPEEEKFPVTNVSTSMVSIPITNERGEPDRVFFRAPGDVRLLTASQIREVYEEYPDMFDGGYLSAPDILQDSPNVIHDLPKFVDSLEYTEIVDRVAEITEPSVLMTLYSYLENLRFVDTDEHGKPLLDDDNLPTIREVPLGPKESNLLMAVRARMQEIAQVNLSISEND